MSKFLKIIFLGISLFSCFPAMATTLGDVYEVTCRFLCEDGDDYSDCYLQCF